jgi:hypothetical protein
MKSTTSVILSKKIAALNLPSNSIVGNMLNNLSTNQFLRPVYSQGSSWKHSSLIDKSFELKQTLDKLGIEYIVGNDAARGGKTGYFVKITTKIK